MRYIIVNDIIEGETYCDIINQYNERTGENIDPEQQFQQEDFDPGAVQGCENQDFTSEEGHCCIAVNNLVAGGIINRVQ